MLGCHSVLVTIYPNLQLILSKTIGIGDTRYHTLSVVFYLKVS